MTWSRDMQAKPLPYKGIQMDSKLEVAVAEQLDRFGVEWTWNLPAMNGLRRATTPYLPDFTIHEASEELDLPMFVEVKPAELLYALRDYFDTEERFEHDLYKPCTAAELRAAGMEEIWKPKALAEELDCQVLVVSALNCSRTLSAWCTRSSVTLSRSHPAVNWKTYVRNKEQEEARARWERESAARQAARDLEMEERRIRLEHQCRTIAAQGHLGAARYDGTCWRCSKRYAAGDMLLHRNGDHWITFCLTCVASLRQS